MTQPLESSVRERARSLLSEVPWPVMNDDVAGKSFVRALAVPEPVEEFTPKEELSDELIAIEDLVIDLAGREVFCGSRTVELTHLEFDLLVFLARNRGRVFTREQLIDRLWSDAVLISHRTVDIHVHRLRTKLGKPWDRWIATVRRVGYKLAVRHSA